MSLSFEALNAKLNGPRGGDLKNPILCPERRTASLNAEVGEAGPNLHRFIRPNDVAVTGLKNEQAWHRMAAYMLLAGRTNSEIAAAAGVVPQAVSILRSQRWFQELLATLANEAGADVTAVLAAEAQASIQVLVDLRDNTEGSDRVRLTAATTLLEQAHGKATQKIVSHTTRSFASPEDQMAEIEQQLAAIAAARQRH